MANLLNDTVNGYQEAKKYTSKSLGEYISIQLGQLYSKHAYNLACKLTGQRRAVMTMKQSFILNRADITSNITYLIEEGLGVIASNIENPVLRGGCKVVAKSTGFGGMLYQGAQAGALLII